VARTPLNARSSLVDTPVEVRESPINGSGMFATAPFTAGALVLVIDDSRIADAAHPLAPADDPRHCDYLAAGKVVLMQSPERYINHSCDPNVYVRTVDGKRLVVALRDIVAGEEVAYDYCINGYGNTVWTCHCHARRCRHTIHSDFFHLPLALQREYLPLLDDWFCEERNAEVEHLAALDRAARLNPQSALS
jgi:uncharacterized protein